MSERPIVCDASVAVAWLRGEQAPTWAGELLRAAEQGSVNVRVPSTFWIEVANALRRVDPRRSQHILEGLIRLEELGFRSAEVDRALRMHAVELAATYGLATYDAVYLALALQVDADIATLDEALGRAAERMGRRFGFPKQSRVSEKAVTYGTDEVPDPISLAAIGAYLAELRASTSG
jgi:predicted nucleic acid-binding protein